MKTRARHFFGHTVAWLAYIALQVALFLQIPFLFGCSAIRPAKPVSPSATISTAGGASVTQTGDAQTPAAVTVSTETRTVPLPAGSAFVFNEKAGTLTLTLARDTTLTTSARTEHAEAPRAFAPPAPPTPAQLAHADGVRWFYVVAILGVVAAGLLAWSGHYLAALKIGAGALSLPILAHFFSSGVAMTVSGVLIAAGVAFWAAWYIAKGKLAASAAQ